MNIRSLGLEDAR